MDHRVADLDLVPSTRSLGPLNGLFAKCRDRQSISLREALIPIFELCQTTHTGIDLNVLQMCVDMCLDFGSIMKNESFGVARDDRISSDCIAAICLYSMEMRGCVSFYAYLNQALRLEDRNEIEPFVMYIWIMMNALQNCPPYEGRQVFRGIKVDVHQEYPTGTRFTWYNFISCTCNAKVLENESFFGTSGQRTLFVIELTTYRGRVVTEYVKLSEEEEVILPPNTVFTVMGVLNLGEGLYMIHLKEELPIDPIIPYGLEGTAAVPNQQQRMSDRNATRQLDPSIPYGFEGTAAVPNQQKRMSDSNTMRQLDPSIPYGLEGTAAVPNQQQRMSDRHTRRQLDPSIPYGLEGTAAVPNQQQRMSERNATRQLDPSIPYGVEGTIESFLLLHILLCIIRQSFCLIGMAGNI